jgi:hypothetical protein
MARHRLFQTVGDWVEKNGMDTYNKEMNAFFIYLFIFNN